MGACVFLEYRPTTTASTSATATATAAFATAATTNNNTDRLLKPIRKKLVVWCYYVYHVKYNYFDIHYVIRCSSFVITSYRSKIYLLIVKIIFIRFF